MAQDMENAVDRGDSLEALGEIRATQAASFVQNKPNFRPFWAGNGVRASKAKPLKANFRRIER